MVADYITIQTRIALARIRSEHPDLDFSVSTPELTAADEALAGECLRWAGGLNKMADVRRAFQRWESALLAADRTQGEMFGVR